VTEPRCPRCGRDVRAGFTYCPYCQVRLGDVPTRRGVEPTPERQGRGDLTAIGCGIIALGILAVIGFVAAMVGTNSSGVAEFGVVVVGGGLLLVFAGSMVAGTGLAGRLVPAASGCGSLALGVGLGTLLFLASVGFLFVTCLAAVTGR
jgi:hypothetical protein